MVRIVLPATTSVFLAIACSSPATPKNCAANAIANVDSNHVKSIDSLNDEAGPTEKRIAVERQRFETQEYSIVVKSIYVLPDTLKEDSTFYCEGQFLFFTKLKDKSVDSIKLTEGCQDGTLIEDLTEKLHFSTPFFDVASPSGSDNYTSEFFGYKNHSLKKLFEIETYWPCNLERKDAHTLTGVEYERDELVYYSQKIPFTVSLEDYSIRYEILEREEIGYSTTVLSGFTGYRLDANNDKVPYFVKKGSPILIDSIDRKLNVVRVKIKDSIAVFVPFSIIKGKVKANDAG